MLLLNVIVSETLELNVFEYYTTAAQTIFFFGAREMLTNVFYYSHTTLSP